MNGKKSVEIVGYSFLAVFSVIVILCLYYLYQSANGIVGSSATAYKTSALIGEVKERLRNAKSADEADVILNSLDDLPKRLVAEDKVKKIKELYRGTLDAAAAGNSSLGEIRVDLFSEMFNFYRALVVRRDFGAASVVSKLLRQGYKNLSVSAKPESVIAFTRLVNERLSTLEGTGSSLRNAEVRELLKINTDLEERARAKRIWLNKGGLTFSKAEAILSQIGKDIAARARDDNSELQRIFLVLCFTFLLACLLGIGFTHMTAKATSRWFEQRLNAFKALFSKFGLSEDKAVEKALLENDKDWGDVFRHSLVSEEKFLESINAEVAIARSVQIPLIVIGPTLQVVHWNSDVTRLLGIRGHDEVGKCSFRDFFQGLKMRSINGIDEFSLDELEAKITTNVRSTFQLNFLIGGEKVPVQVSIDPIFEGVFGKGAAIIIQDLREEDTRVSERVTQNLKQVSALVNSIEANEDVDFSDIDMNRIPERVQGIIDGLRNIYVYHGEREELWRSEVESILDQVAKQSEFIESNSTDMTALQTKYEQLATLVQDRADRLDSMESSLIELQRKLAGSDAVWKRVVASIEKTKGLELEATTYEKKVQNIRDEMQKWYSQFDASVENIRKCREWVKLQAINVNVGEEDIRTFRDRARKFAFAISEFYERVSSIRQDIKGFVDRHPGAAVLTAMKAADDWDTLVGQIDAFYGDVSQSLQTLSQEQHQTISDFTKIRLLQDELHRLQEELRMVNSKSSLVNDRTKETLSRWS